MALTVVCIEQLIRLREAGFLADSRAVIEIGAQQLANDFLRSHDRLEYLGRLFGVAASFDLAAPQPTRLVEGGIEHVPETAPLARGFWEWLGFEYAAVDIDGSSNSIPLDLNFDAIPEAARKHFTLVTNFGTTEHAANQLNAFKIIHDLTAPGGIMLHTVPAQGYLNHGLVNYNPKWFWMLARSNAYRWIHFDYNSADSATDFPDNVAAEIMRYAPDIAERKDRYKFVDGGLTVILQKVQDIAFIPPLDIATGTKTTNKALIERYWTVFGADQDGRSREN
jgi:hypothetical protein